MKINRSTRLVLIYGIIFLAAGYFLPQEVDWSTSFSKDHSIPYGCQVLYSELENLFNGSKVTVNSESLYEIKGNLPTGGATLIMIDEYMELDSLDLNLLYQFVSEGNQVLMAAHGFPSSILDTFGVSIAYDFKVNEIIRGGFEGTELSHNFYSNEMKRDSSYRFLSDASIRYFVSSDSIDQCLGLAWVGETINANLVSKSIGNGSIFLHSDPFAFTNLNILSNEGSDYIAGVLSHLPEGQVIWDEHYKEINLNQQVSMLNVVLEDKALKKAVYLSIIGLVLILLFMSKRKQRIIPTVDSFSNDSKELVMTIGDMFYNNSDNGELVSKKIALFRQDMHRRYGVSELVWNDEIIEMIAEKTGKDKELIRETLGLINNLKGTSNPTDLQLKKINDLINSITHGTNTRRATTT